MLHMHTVDFMLKCPRSGSSLINFIARYGIIYGQIDSIIGRLILNCSSHYNISLDNILNLHFQSRDIYSYFRTNVYRQFGFIISSFIELLQLSLSNSYFNMANIDRKSVV